MVAEQVTFRSTAEQMERDVTYFSTTTKKGCAWVFKPELPARKHLRGAQGKQTFRDYWEEGQFSLILYPDVKNVSTIK